jgi:GNAT superfamily N-acetyltransferase
VVFLRRRGYRLEQIERISFLHLPVNEALLENAFRAARDAAGDQYEVVAWTGRTPQDRIEDLLVLRARMSVDAPSAGLEVDEEPWTPARLAKHDDALAIGEQNRLTVAAQYRPTGRLVGFSELVVPNDRARSVQQQDTLVLSEHRGHRLGMLLKAANLQRLAQLRPRPPLVSTFNAEENRHMLAVNEAIGFRAVGCAGCWRKDA